MTYKVCYSIVTPESAAVGECAETGDIGEFPRLRDAIGAVAGTRTSRVSGCDIGANASPLDASSWLYVDNGMEFETGAQESRTLHFPRHVTRASRARVLKLLRS